MANCPCQMCEAYARGVAYPLAEHAILEHHEADLYAACRNRLAPLASHEAVLALRAKVLAHLHKWDGYTAAEPVAVWLGQITVDVDSRTQSSSPWQVYSRDDGYWQSPACAALIAKRVRQLVRSWSRAERDDVTQEIYLRLYGAMRVPRGLAVPPVKFLQFNINSVLSHTKDKLRSLAREIPVGDSLTDAGTDSSAPLDDEVNVRVSFKKDVGLKLADVDMTLHNLEAITADAATWTAFCERLKEKATRGARKNGIPLKRVYSVGNFVLVLVAWGDEPRMERMRQELRRVLEVRRPHRQMLKRDDL